MPPMTIVAKGPDCKRWILSNKNNFYNVHFPVNGTKYFWVRRLINYQSTGKFKIVATISERRVSSLVLQAILIFWFLFQFVITDRSIKFVCGYYSTHWAFLFYKLGQ